jgi:hypothetical protein
MGSRVRGGRFGESLDGIEDLILGVASEVPFDRYPQS